MNITYIRPDKNFDAAYEQLKQVNAYAELHNMPIGNEYIDQESQNQRIDYRTKVVDFFRENEGANLIIYDTWVLSSHIEDLVHMFSCLLKRRIEIHIVKQSIIINPDSNIMLGLALIDQLRQVLLLNESKAIGRPKGSRSSSKFDKHHDIIIGYIKEGKSVSAMARLLEVSRSSLKDYIESRELKNVANDTNRIVINEDAEDQIIEQIQCPTPKNTTQKETR